eukprot:1134898-Pyramimonas_sp.AAC.1
MASHITTPLTVEELKVSAERRNSIALSTEGTYRQCCNLLSAATPRQCCGSSAIVLYPHHHGNFFYHDRFGQSTQPLQIAGRVVILGHIVVVERLHEGFRQRFLALPVGRGFAELLGERSDSLLQARPEQSLLLVSCRDARCSDQAPESTAKKAFDFNSTVGCRH